MCVCVCVDNDLIYLDPHTTQPVVSARPDGSVPDSTYHTSAYGRMHISGLDPSVALGFFCKDEEDLDNLVHRLKQVLGEFVEVPLGEHSCDQYNSTH